MQAQPWTLGRAIEVALENSPDGRVAQARIAGAEAMLDEARSYGLPQVSLKSSYTQTDSPMMAFGSILNQRAFDFGLDFNNPGTIDNLNATATVGINLYSGGQVSAGKRAAEAGVSAAGFDEAATRQQLTAQTVKAYLDIRKAGEAVSAVDAGVKAYEAAVSNARLRFDAGQVLKSDLLSLEVKLAQTKEQLVEVQHFQRLARRAFAFVLGLPANGAEIELVEEDEALDRIVEPDTLDYSERPELQALREREVAAEQMRVLASGGRKPRVMGFASYQYDHGWETTEGADSWLAGVSVNLDVFNGGKSESKIRQAEAQLSELREYIRKAELGIGLEVEQARLAVELAKDRVAVAELALAQAEESASLSRSRFKEGALLTAELIGVESRLMEARMRRAVALADKTIVIAQLRKAVGVSPLQD
ncbi:outer membrane efflux protein [Verrucomicrobiia bacterium DG1235]|nr:outer membrane efflux protein [Verrucomicrobiae bacterium DG1235]